MRVKIQQSDLLPVLQSVSRSVGVKSTLPVLANILIQTQSGKLKLSATNLEIGVVERVNCEILEEGEITIPARTFLEIIQALPSEEIDIEATPEILKITAKNFSANLNGIQASEFPTIPLSSEKSVDIKADILKTSIPQLSFAAASDEGRPVLTGILTELKKDSLELVATDGFRLARKTVKLEGSQDLSLRVLIPRRTFEEVVRLISEQQSNGEDETIKISTSENQNQIIFKIGLTEVSSRLIEGNFPSWEKIIPVNIENRTI
ncbi:MAG: polymerase III subunit beta protein, partial [Candidatus Daviesbacteria bacterium GW2011_GWB1_36_5]